MTFFSDELGRRLQSYIDEQTKLLFNVLPFNSCLHADDESELLANQSVGNISTPANDTSHIIIGLVCDTIREELGLKEGYIGFPAPLVGDRYARSCTCHLGRPELEERQLLKTLSIVSRRSTRPAQAALRSRIDIKCPHVLVRFSRSSFCGPWVQELQHVIGMDALRDIIRGVPNNTLRDLTSVLARTHRLRALSITMDNLGVVEGELSLMIFIPSIPLSLQSLHIQLSVWTDETLGQLNDAVSNLYNLHTLSVIGYTFRTGPSVFTSPWSVGNRKSPPASLKRLLFEFRTMTTGVVTHLSWLFTPREDYSLHELKIRQNLTFQPCGVQDPIRALLPVLVPALRDLKVLEVRLLRLRPGFLYEFYCPASFQCLVDGCTSLEELHAYVFGIPLPALDLPRSLRHLHIFKSLDCLEDTASRDKELVEILAPLLKLRNLRSLDVSEYTDHNKKHGLFLTEELCKEFSVDVSTTLDLAGCTWTRSRVV